MKKGTNWLFLASTDDKHAAESVTDLLSIFVPIERRVHASPPTCSLSNNFPLIYIVVYYTIILNKGREGIEMATFSRLFHVFVLLATFFGMGVADLPLEMLQGVHKKFEFKYSFKAPMLVNSKGEVPFWDRGGGKKKREKEKFIRSIPFCECVCF